MVLREKSSKQKQMGAYYTPPELAYELPRLNSLSETTLFRRGFLSG